MKKYRVLAETITTHKGLLFQKDQVVSEIKFHPDHIKGLIDGGSIEEVVEKPEAEKPTETGKPKK